MTGSAVRIDHLTPSGLPSHSPPLSLSPTIPPWPRRAGPGAGPFASAAVRPRASEILGGAFLVRQAWRVAP
jgi:hypothetical protein